jgi:DNA-directed RNA polymerase specialized sigma24 family protein
MSHRFEEHVPSVYGYLSYRLGSQTAAEELTLATLESGALGGVAVGAGVGETKTSLLAIAHRLAASHPAAGTASGDPRVSAELARALEQLPARERAVLALRYGARLSGPEAALVLGQSEADANRWFSRGLRRLRTDLEREERGQEQDANP